MKPCIIIVILFLIFCVFPPVVLATQNPLTVSNNAFGIHILFPEELQQAASLVNSNGGEWGYVIIPIQAGDRDIDKWQHFMDLAKQNKIIPIIRLATEGDYFNTKVWRKPTEADILDFANFLNSLEWPTKNRYIVMFNEVNRSDEWGGAANPFEYARLLSYGVDTFKNENENFFIISSGMDNAAATVLGSAYSQYSYFKLMNQEVPDIFSKIDGIASHSYPNPAFAQPPSKQDYNSIASFRFESQLIDQMSTKKLPIFITETGWSKERVPEERIALYLKEAYASVWNNERIVAVTPFLLRAGSGPFVQFSFINTNNSYGKEYTAIEEIPKQKGTPVLSEKVLGVEIKKKPAAITKKFPLDQKAVVAPIIISPRLQILFKWLLDW